MATLKSIKNKYLTISDGDVLGVTTNTENVAALSFKLATADSLTKFNMVDGFSDDYNDATGVDSSASTNDARSSSNYYSGTAADPPPGGTITYSGGKTIQTFNTADNGTSTNIWTPTASSSDIEYLIVAGGASGGNSAGGSNQGGGGGGAGGYLTATGFSITAQAYTIVAGAGGPGINYDTSGGARGEDGGVSSFAGITATGGGGGGTKGGSVDGRSGGSGGGASKNGSGGAASPAGQGYAGGSAGQTEPGGGGGGASAVGRSGTNGGDGGDGLANSITGSSVTYAGGGGGGEEVGATPSPGGAGGGGAGGQDPGGAGTPGTNGLGGGGGGSASSNSANSGTGGNGVVIISYPDGTFVEYNDLTLASNAFTAQAAPTTARIILDEWAYKGSQTLNTDIKAYASRDNGTTYTQMTLANQGNLTPSGDGGIQGNTILMMHCDGANGGTTFTDVSSEGGNTAQTCAANGNAQTKTDQFKFGTASAYFDGTGDYVKVTGDAEQWAFASEDFTIDFWIRPGTASTQQRVFGDLNSAGNAAGFEFIQGGDDKMGFSGSAPGGLALNDPTVMTMDTWYHFAVTRLGNEFRMYRDGVSVATVTIAGGMHRGLIPIGIGRSGDYDAQYFEGYIDEVRIQNGIAVWSGAASFTPPVAPYAVSHRLLSGSVDISGQPSGTDMKYKITTHNQAIAKQTRVYGTSMAWA